MSARFNNTTTSKLLNSAAPLSATPFTVGFWIFPTNNTGTWWSLCNTGTTTDYFELSGLATQWSITAASAVFGGANTVRVGTVTTNKWAYVLGRFISPSSRRISVLQFGGDVVHTSSSTSVTPASVTAMALGIRNHSTPTNGCFALIGEFWYANTDIQGLNIQTKNDLVYKVAYDGPFSIPFIANNIIEYKSLFQDLSPESFSDESYLGGGVPYQDWSNTNVKVDAHPPITYRGRYNLKTNGAFDLRELLAGLPSSGGIDTNAPRAGTSTGVAVVSGKIAVLNEHRGISTGVAVVTGREAVQDAKRSIVVGKAVVAGTATQNTTFTRSGTSTGVAVVTARDASQDAKRSTVVGKAVVSGTLTQQTQLSKSGSSIGVAVDTGREAVQDAKRSTVTGVAVVTGVATSTSSRDQSRTGTSTGVAVVTARDASQDAKHSTVAGVAAVAAKGAVQDEKRSTVLGKTVVTGVGTSTSAGGSQSRAGTSVGLAIVNARTAWMAEIAGHAIGVAIVNGVATSSGGAGTGDEARFNPLIASVAKLMNR